MKSRSDDLYLHRGLCPECGYTVYTDAPLALVEPGCQVCGHELPSWEPVTLCERGASVAVREQLLIERERRFRAIQDAVSRVVRGMQ